MVRGSGHGQSADRVEVSKARQCGPLWCGTEPGRGGEGGVDQTLRSRSGARRDLPVPSHFVKEFHVV